MFDFPHDGNPSLDEIEEWQEHLFMTDIVESYSSVKPSHSLAKLIKEKKKSKCIWCKRPTPFVPEDMILVIDIRNHIHIKKCFPLLMLHAERTGKLKEIQIDKQV